MGNKSSARQRTKGRKIPNMIAEEIVIDRTKGLVFATEEELYAHFLPQITAFETELRENRTQEDLPESGFEDYEDLLQQTLDEPDEIWEDAVSIHGYKTYNYVGSYSNDDETVYYVAVCYLTEGVPSFVFLHFPTHEIELANRFRRGELLYDRALKEVEQGAIEGDALSEGDELAVGLYKAMVTLRNEKDIKESEFQEYESLRDLTIDEPDEIWRSNDLSGNILVTFIRDFSDSPEHGKGDIKYVVVTLEDSDSNSHSLMLSFPTNDEALLERYRHGENLQAEEVIQEASH